VVKREFEIEAEILVSLSGTGRWVHWQSLLGVKG